MKRSLGKQQLKKLAKNTGLPTSLIEFRLRMGWPLVKIGARSLEDL